MGVWEPLLEPLEDETKDNFRPWSLELKVLSLHTHFTRVHAHLCTLTLLTIVQPDEEEASEVHWFVG